MIHLFGGGFQSHPARRVHDKPMLDVSFGSASVEFAIVSDNCLVGQAPLGTGKVAVRLTDSDEAEASFHFGRPLTLHTNFTFKWRDCLRTNIARQMQTKGTHISPENPNRPKRTMPKQRCACAHVAV